MDALSYKTISVNKQTADKKWVVVDAEDLVLGRMASKVAKVLRGKYKPSYTPHADCGDNVIIINAEKVRLTGNKWEGRTFFRHTGYPGGRRDISPKELFEQDPRRLVQRAVKGMLPKNRLGAKLLTNLRVYVGSEHDYAAQTPQVLDLEKIK